MVPTKTGHSRLNASNSYEESSSGSGSEGTGSESSPATSEASPSNDSMLDNSLLRGPGGLDEKKNVEVFDEYFSDLSSEILIVLKYDKLLFLENRKRDKVLLEVKYN